jgi:hypothetical protein
MTQDEFDKTPGNAVNDLVGNSIRSIGFEAEVDLVIDIIHGDKDAGAVKAISVLKISSFEIWAITCVVEYNGASPWVSCSCSLTET